MSDQISGKQFDELAGADGWRALWGGGRACAHFRTGSFGAGAALVQAISELPSAAGHQVDVDLRGDGVTVRLFTGYPGGLSDKDVEVARDISAAARDLDLTADPSAVQHIQVAIDALAIPAVRPFWRAVLGYDEFDDADLLDPQRSWPSFWFQQMDAERPQRGRIHIDVYVPRDQVEARIAAATRGRRAHGPGQRPRLVDARRRRGQRGRPCRLGLRASLRLHCGQRACYRLRR